MSPAELWARLRAELAEERRRRAEAEQQRDVMQDELRRVLARLEVIRQIG